MMARDIEVTITGLDEAQKWAEDMRGLCDRLESLRDAYDARKAARDRRRKWLPWLPAIILAGVAVVLAVLLVSGAARADRAVTLSVNESAPPIVVYDTVSAPLLSIWADGTVQLMDRTAPRTLGLRWAWEVQMAFHARDVCRRIMEWNTPPSGDVVRECAAFDGWDLAALLWDTLFDEAARSAREWRAP